jgi:hypothetical protein
MASPTPESSGHGNRSLQGLESAYTITSAAPALEVLQSISSSLQVTLLLLGWGCVVNVHVLMLTLRSPSTILQSSTELSMPPNVNLLVRKTPWVPGPADLSSVLVAEGVFMLCRRISES